VLPSSNNDIIFELSFVYTSILLSMHSLNCASFVQFILSRNQSNDKVISRFSRDSILGVNLPKVIDCSLLSMRVLKCNLR